VPEGETVPLGRGLSGVHLIAEYPRITDDDGDYYVRRAYKDRAEIGDFKRNVEALLAKLDEGLETGQWKASPGLPWCSYCPKRSACPIPNEQLPTQIATEGEAMENGEQILLLEKRLADARSNVRVYLAEHESFEAGGRVFLLDSQQKEDWLKKPSTKHEGSKEQVKGILRKHGHDPDEFWKKSVATPLKHKKKEDEDDA
jgi:hypothetical protein